MFESIGPLSVAAFILIWLSEEETMSAVKSGKELQKKWRDDNMVAAVLAVKKKVLTVAAAALKFKVTHKTL